MTLKEITFPVQEDILLFENKYKEIMQSNVLIVDIVAKYIVKHRGKFLRPTLVLLSARISGKPTKNTYIAAAIVELLHVATLVHDDVVDDSDLRHGILSIKGKWKNKIAVLMGDYLLSKSLIGATQTDSLDIIHILANAAKRLSKGELNQLEKSRKLDITEDEYFSLIADKTAALISSCSELGALTASSDNPEYRQAMKLYGEYLGIAFQIKDDLLDYQSNLKILGKPAGADLKESKLTLPMIYALSQVSKNDSKSILKKMKKGLKNKQLRDVIQFVVDQNGIEYAYEKAREFGQKAKNELAIFPDSQYRDACLSLVDYVIERRK